MLIEPLRSHIFPRIKIRDKLRRVVTFVPNVAQTMALEEIERRHDVTTPLRIIFLKARQEGISSLIEAILIGHAAIYPNAANLIVAHEAKPAKTLFERATLMWRCLPMRPRSPATLHRLLFPHRDGDSTIQLGTAGSLSGRGSTFNAVHFSEAPYFPSEQGLMSLLPTVPSNDPASLVAIEGTANGRVGIGQEFYDVWQDANSGHSDFIPIFIPWWVDPDYVRPADEARDAPIDDDEKELLRLFSANKLTKEQSLSRLAWRRWAISNICQGYIQRFNQEYPWCPEVAFLSSGDPAFVLEELELARRHVREPQAVGILDRDAAGKIVIRRGLAGSAGLRIFKPPEPGHEYYLGGDFARGSENGDFGAAVVWDGMTGEQAATYSGRVGAVAIAQIIDKLARYYNDALVNGELTGGYGVHVLQELMDKCGYYNHYRWVGKKDDARPRNSRKLWWDTNYYSSERMQTAFREALRQDEIIVYDETLYTQMAAAVRMRGHWEARYGHDDVLMAALIGWIARVDYPPTRRLAAYPDQMERLERKHAQAPSDLPLGVEPMFENWHRKVKQIEQGRLLSRNPYAGL